MESCHFRDLASEFAELGASRVGISADPVDRQKKFDDKNGLGFPLLSDPDREVHKLMETARTMFLRCITLTKHLASTKSGRGENQTIVN